MPSGSPERRESLADKQVLIVGYGQIGEAIEARLLPFEAAVTRVARSARDGVHAIDELPDLLPEADVVVLIVPGHRGDQGLFDAEMLAHLKDGALLVNVSRGPVVDTDALLAELRERADPRRPRRRRPRAAAGGPPAVARARTCCSSRTSAATAARWSRGPTSSSASSSSATPRASRSRTW